ncbi:hypothetical protein [Bradyrhizobium sp. 930_D9_N1_4]
MLSGFGWADNSADWHKMYEWSSYTLFKAAVIREATDAIAIVR